VKDNHFIEPPASPEQGYHLSKDLADQAITMIRNQKSSSPSKPWFMFYNPVPITPRTTRRRKYIDKYKGKFDDGYDAYRTWVLARMMKRACCRGHQAHAHQPAAEVAGEPGDAVRPWNTLSADEKKLFSRHAEVWPGSPNTPTCRSAA